MKSSERFVLDTNVIVSAVLSPRSVPRQAFDRAFLLGTVLVSDSILVEQHETKLNDKKHYPLRGMPIQIEADFDAPRTDLWAALGE